MANDYQGDVKKFALFVPVPVVLKADQVHVEDNIIERLDAFSAPRLVKYFDKDPWANNYFNDALISAPASEYNGSDWLNINENISLKLLSFCRFRTSSYCGHLQIQLILICYYKLCWLKSFHKIGVLHNMQ